MPEHFTFEQALGDTSKIHFHKRMFGSLTVDMNGLGYQFLTCSAFPCNEDRGIGLCYAGNRVQHIHQSLATSDDVAAIERIALFLRWFLWSARKLECRFDTLQQGGIIPGLRYEIKSSRLHSLYGKLDTSPSGHQYHRCFGTEYFYLFE